MFRILTSNATRNAKIDCGNLDLQISAERVFLVPRYKKRRFEVGVNMKRIDEKLVELTPTSATGDQITREQLDRLEEICAEVAPLCEAMKDRATDALGSGPDAHLSHADFTRLQARMGDILGEAGRCLDGSLRSPEDGSPAHP